jgi:hypothetical protein
VQRIDQILVAQYRGTPIQPIVDLARLVNAWDELQGEPWGSASWPLRLQNGILFVGVADASWAQRLAYDSRKIVRRVEQLLGYGVKLRHRIVPTEPEPEPFSPVEPRWDDPHVREAVKHVPPGPLRIALETYLAHLAAFQERNAARLSPVKL